MQIFFKEIVAGDLDAVRARIDKTPNSVALVASASPKMYAGQSPLQLAYRHDRFEIAAMLLEHGADPNFVEQHEAGQSVLALASQAAVAGSRWLRPASPAPDNQEWLHARTAEQAQASYEALLALLGAGARADLVDSHGWSSVGSAAMYAKQFLPRVRYNDPEWVDPKPLNPELVADLTRIFNALIEHGADPARPAEGNLGMPLAEYFRAEALGRILSGIDDVQ